MWWWLPFLPFGFGRIRAVSYFSLASLFFLDFFSRLQFPRFIFGRVLKFGPGDLAGGPCPIPGHRPGVNESEVLQSTTQASYFALKTEHLNRFYLETDQLNKQA